jgi:hypothetical protein
LDTVKIHKTSAIFQTKNKKKKKRVREEKKKKKKKKSFFFYPGRGVSERGGCGAMDSDRLSHGPFDDAIANDAVAEPERLPEQRRRHERREQNQSQVVQRLEPRGHVDGCHATSHRAAQTRHREQIEQRRHHAVGPVRHQRQS